MAIEGKAGPIIRECRCDMFGNDAVPDVAQFESFGGDVNELG